MVQALQRAGENIILDGGLTLISAVTGIVQEQQRCRAVRFLPAIAARERRPLVNELKLFMLEHPGAKYFRYAVITHGELIPAFGNIRGAIQKLSRRISKWHSEVCKEAKINVHFRGIEFTRATAKERDDKAKERGQVSDLSSRYGADTVLYHVHANVLYQPAKNIYKLWSKFLSDTHKFFGSEWKDCDRVQKVEEIVKYCSKPADTMAASDDELVWLYREMDRLKICQPLGQFKEWRAELEKRGEKVVRVHDGHGNGNLMRVKKGTRGGKDEDVEVDGDGDGDGVIIAADVFPEKASEVLEKQKKDSDTGPAKNIVVGLTLPQWRHSPWSEPMIMIQNYDARKLSDEDDFHIEEWQREAREWWDAAGAPKPAEALRIAREALDAAMSPDDIREAALAACYIVHTCESTVREAEGTESGSSKESENQVSSSIVETDDLLKMAVAEVIKRGDRTKSGVNDVLISIAKRHRCVQHEPLPTVVDVQMQIWRQRRADEVVDAMFAA